MRAHVLKSCRQYINLFGYTKIAGQENPCGFFEYENLSAEEIESSGSYTRINDEQMRWRINEREEQDQKTVVLNKQGDGIQIKFNDEPFIKLAKIRPNVVMQK